MKNKKKLLVCGSYGAKNIGDELILKGILEYFKDQEISILSESKLNNYKTFPKFPSGVRSLLNFIKGNRENLKALKESDYFILGGGNLFGGPCKKANIIWAIQAFFAIVYKKSIIMFCQSVGTNTNKVIEILIKYIFNKSFKIYLRDEESATILKNLGVTKKITILSDPAILLENISQNNQRKNLIISLRQKTNLNISIIPKIQKFIKKYPNTEKIKLLSFETGQDNDDIPHKKIIENSNISAEIINFENNPTEVLNEFQKANLAICMRLHAIIVAIITQTPFIAISYAKKIDTFLKYANLEELLINENEISVKLLEEKQKYIESHKTEILEKMHNFIKKSKNKFEAEREIIFQENAHLIEQKTPAS